MYEELVFERSQSPGKRPAAGERLGFGRRFTDHMLLMDYEEGAGWHHPRIVPFGPLTLDPSAMVFHYGQAVFEGLKAYRMDSGEIGLFRPDRHADRLNASAERLCMPAVDPSFLTKALSELIAADADWVPAAPGASLYARPLMIATEPGLGVRPSCRYLLAVLLSPVDAYYDNGMQPIDILIEDRYVRTVRGGTGAAKTPGNYAGSLKAQQLARQGGCEQVLWLDGVERKWVEEVGSMNVFFVIDGAVVTPPLEGSILDGVTRNSALELLRSWGMRVEERRLSVSELWEAARSGRLEEAFGTGTAAVVAPIGGLRLDGVTLPVGGRGIGSLSRRLYDAITGIQYGRLPDTHGWMTVCSQGGSQPAD